MRATASKGWGLAAAAGMVLATAAGGAVAEPRSDAGPGIAVVVQAASADHARDALLQHGGTVEHDLSFLDAVSGRVPPAGADALAALAATGQVTVTPDTPLHFASVDVDVDAPTRGAQLEALNPGDRWSLETGAGVGVALIDTGVAETDDLAGRVIHGPDYSGDTVVDEGGPGDDYGHGTFVAGLIAGDGSASTGPTPHRGVAPGAHIVSLKMAGRDGVTSLSKVLDAIGWVVVNQEEHGIRVLNLSIGVPTNAAPQADPLSAAVQAAWASGITVVAAAGNDGAGGVASPGRDPWVITVGATDTNGTADTSDDVVPAWSGHGKVTSEVKPELVAPGVSVVSLRAHGSAIDEDFPEAQIEDDYFRGSGTSMSAALVSGAVAALAEFRPRATPDDLKGALVSTGRSVDGTSAHGVDLAAAELAEPDIAWRQDHRIAFNRLDGRLKKGMPWAQSGAPAPEETWVRMGWADGEWARMGWADAEFARMGWARMGWAEANYARMGWADAHFTRMGWARMGWARMGWAGQHWTTRDRWVRMGWADASWGTEPQ